MTKRNPPRSTNAWHTIRARQNSPRPSRPDWRRGPEATTLLGKAVKIAHESGNEATAKLLRAVVDVQDAATGTVRLKRNVAKEDTMALETRSTKTRRLPPSAPPPGGQA